ncbi:unnamed protein product [Blepharisma stoltei]|uniref:Charged multivesicular body protein 6 n=1 Tax=Blepharisma stoltei TaxID=1481888 RepID=A0AAU9JU08_9CILI|nr:unnamed protein product [Blepharisma stoltei]
MGACFGNSNKAKAPENSKTRISQEDKEIAQLKSTRDKVKHFLKKLESNIQSCKEAVKTCIKNKDKPRAMLALKKQKYLEKNLESGQNQLINLEQIINDVEQAQIQRDVVQAMKQGTEFLKQINDQLTINDVEKLMADTEDAIEYQQEIGRLLAQQGIQESDQDLEKELEKLDEVEALEVESEIPAPPKHKKHKKKKVFEEEENEEKVEVYA